MSTLSSHFFQEQWVCFWRYFSADNNTVCSLKQKKKRRKKVPRVVYLNQTLRRFPTAERFTPKSEQSAMCFYTKSLAERFTPKLYVNVLHRKYSRVRVSYQNTRVCFNCFTSTLQLVFYTELITAEYFKQKLQSSVFNQYLGELPVWQN